MKTKHFYLFLLASVLISFSLQARTTAPLPPTLTAGIFLYYPGVTIGKGSANNGHPDEVEILAFSFGFSKGSVNPALQDYSLTKYADGSTNALQTLLVSGASENGAEIRIYKTVSGVVTLISKTQFKNVVIRTYNSGGSGSELNSGCSTCSGLTENISFSFTGIKIDNFTYNYQ